MPQTRSQSKLLSRILYAEVSSAASDQAIAKSTDSIDSCSTYQPTSSPEDSPANSVASVASVDSQIQLFLTLKDIKGTKT